MQRSGLTGQREPLLGAHAELVGSSTYQLTLEDIQKLSFSNMCFFFPGAAHDSETALVEDHRQNKLHINGNPLDTAENTPTWSLSHQNNLPSLKKALKRIFPQQYGRIIQAHSNAATELVCRLVAPEPLYIER